MLHDKKWTEAEKAYARHLRTRGWRRIRIAQALNKTEMAIKGFFDRDGVKKPGRDAVRHVLKVEQSVFADRDRRANEPRAAGGMMGEPPFSQSALAGPSPRGG